MSRPHPSYCPFSKTSPEGRLRVIVTYRDIDPNQDRHQALRLRQPIFQMQNTASGQILWTREGNGRTEAYSTVRVSDDGWTMLQFANQGRQHARLVAVNTEGRDVLTVGISSRDISGIPDSPPVTGEYVLWLDEHVSHTTAGTLWTYHARFRFVAWGGCRHFVCRTGWGRYLALDLENARVLNEKDADTEAFYLWLRGTDEDWALEILQNTCDHQQELEYRLRANDLGETEIPEHLETLWDEASTALQVVRQEQTLAAAVLLEKLQGFSGGGSQKSIDISPVENFNAICIPSFRKDVHLAMLRVGAKPKGYAINLFIEDMWSYTEENVLNLPECVENREEILRSFGLGSAPKDVVFRLGAPEFIRGSWHDEVTCPWGDDFYFECWDYDIPDQDGTPVSWGLLWRRAKRPVTHEEKNMSVADIFIKCTKIEKGEIPAEKHSEDQSAAELMSVTRFVWDEAYWMMREEDIPISLARERLTQKGTTEPI